ncbi:MAG: hypothetical protein WAK27_02785 [Candidatus Sulfotelmatobacter sp.]
MPPPPLNNYLKTKDLVLSRVLPILGMVLAFVGTTDMFPIYVNLAVYVTGLFAIEIGVWRWENANRWGRIGRFVTISAVGVLYALLLVQPIEKQYVRENDMKLSFREFSGISWWDQWRITHHFARMRDRFIALGIAVPPETPPIDMKAGTTFETRFAVNLPAYRGYLSANRTDFKNVGVRAFTYEYSVYVVSSALGIKTGYATDRTVQQNVVSNSFGEYFDRAYWNKSDGPSFGFWTEPLSRIREKLPGRDGVSGKRFTDEIAAAALKSFVDAPDEGANPDVNIYFCNHLKIGDDIRDSGNARWPEILAILKNDNPKYGQVCPP